MRLDPKPENPCFGCGGANARGMQLAFEQNDERQRIVGRFQLGDEYQGGSGFLHGGIIALLLDEVMGKASRFYGEHVVTADLRVEYLRPIRVDQEIVVEGFVARRDGRQLYHEGEIRNAAGNVLARGQGRFVIIDREKYRKQ
ncbi:MAG: PaaI family thioesterase [Acidobacteriia bacterium]|nr:PaaI family thioesterase [Terriglobia bacterium]